MSSVCHFYYHLRNHSSKASTLDQAKSKTLPALLKDRLDNLAAAKKQSVHLKERLLVELSEYFEASLQLLQTLTKISNEFCFTLEPARCELFVRYHEIVIGNLRKKMRCLELELEDQLYAGEQGEALRLKGETFRNMEAELQRTRLENKRRLAEYRQAGSEFQTLAKDYAKYVKDINMIKEDLARLGVDD
ncbi:hypothetical protein HDU76_013082 [Blyttiomyces sp. JEL0837]|nr:hypothetical protein HDU76_013082 [Blyttiomyces sp. JEL0837]